MRIVERVCLYLVVGFVVFSLLDRARADDDGEKGGAATPKTLTAETVEIRNAKGAVVLRLGASASGGGQIEVLNAAGKRVSRLYARLDHDGEMQLFDEKGIYRANLGGNEDGGYLNIQDRVGNQATYIGGDGNADGGYLVVYGPEGKKRVELGGTKTGGTLTLRHAGSDKKALELGATAKGGAVLVFNVETEKMVGYLGAAPDTGTGVMMLAEPTGKKGVAQYTSKHGGQINVYNSAGKKAGFLGVSANPAGNGLLYVGRTDGQRLFEAGATNGGGGYLSIKNGLDKRVIFMGSTTGDASDDGVLEVQSKTGTLGCVLRAYKGGNSVRVYDGAGKVKSQLR